MSGKTLKGTPEEAHFTICSLDGCPFCDRAKKMLQDSKYSFYIRNVAQKDKARFKQQNQMDTFPQIFFTLTSRMPSGTLCTERFKVGGSQELEKAIQRV